MPDAPSAFHVARRHGGAFLIPYAALFGAGIATDEGATTGARMLAVAIVGVAAGALWQFLHRRDLVDRLTHFAAAFTITAAAIFVLAWDSPVSGSFGLGTCGAAILTGCVFGEQWQRARDHRRVAVAPGQSAGAASA
jgi:hypothetical protein